MPGMACGQLGKLFGGIVRIAMTGWRGCAWLAPGGLPLRRCNAQTSCMRADILILIIVLILTIATAVVLALDVALAMGWCH